VKLLVLNGPNLNMLGVREPHIYGTGTLRDLEAAVQAHCDKLGIGVRFFQSNHEGALVDSIQQALGQADGIVLNPAAYTHTSVALLDALKAVGLPAVEVHLSDTGAREPFRAISYVRPACIATVQGKGVQGYLEAVDILAAHLQQTASAPAGEA
jgi:3-dehydroquinate dehydratase type II